MRDVGTRQRYRARSRRPWNSRGRGMMDAMAARSLRQVVTPYRIVSTVALVAALLLAVYGFQSSKDQRATPCGGGAIVTLLPCPGDRDLRQGLIGASLTSGYTGALVVDSTEIPEDQVRTGGPNQLYFQPGPGTETGALAPGTHTATILYWPLTSDREHAQTYSWTFSVS
jgi:hypothetical protein